MKHSDLKSMNLDELWSLHEELASVLARKLADEKTLLDRRLRQLGSSAVGNTAAVRKDPEKISIARRPYPRVLPKYRNPAKPDETWAGRGKQPRWLTAQLKLGKKLDDFRIQPLRNRGRVSTKKF